MDSANHISSTPVEIFGRRILASPSNDASEWDAEETYLDQDIELDLIADGGNDDQESTGLDVGEQLDDVLGESVGDNEPIELDLGTFVSADEQQREGVEDHDSGLAVDPAVGLELPDALLPDDGSEGLDDHAIAVDESKFPALETDDGAEGIAAEAEIMLGSANDEAPVPLAEHPFRVLKPNTPLEACAALAARGPNVVAASSDLLWFRPDSNTPLRLAIDGSALSDLVLLGASHDLALALTRTGQLFRRGRFASQAEQLSRLRDYHKPAPATRAAFCFGGSLGASAPRVLILGVDGSLTEMLDAGDHFARVSLPGTAVAIARESATLIVARGRERALVSLAGEERTISAINGRALGLAQSEAPLIATCDEYIALSAFGRALMISRDRGLTFRQVSGTANTTAIAGAQIDGKARFFAAIYRETTDQTDILLLDPELATALSVAQLDGNIEPAESDPVERGEWAKVSRLIWHTPSGRLWAAGGFGVFSFAPRDVT